MTPEMPSYERVKPARLDGDHVRSGKGPVVDGDTQIYKWLLAHDNKDWEVTENGVWGRLLEVDTADPPKPEQTAFSREWLAGAMASAEPWPLLILPIKRDSFGRWLIYVWDRATGESLNDAIIAAGYSLPVDALAMLARPEQFVKMATRKELLSR